MRTLIVIPTLNESHYIAATISQLLDSAAATDVTLVVADGGSDDGTPDIVTTLAAADDRIKLLHNPDRKQGPGINLAVRRYGAGHHILLRADAHCKYPHNFVDQVTDTLASKEAEGFVAVVVGMATVGFTPVQRAVAAAQNSVLGNGGSAHRRAPQSGEVDHGHHAAMILDRFAEVGGYDCTLRANEDAELDNRLLARGGRIWLDGEATITYYPRSTLPALAQQYYIYGWGRAQNIRISKITPVPRQVAPAAATAVNVVSAVAALRDKRVLLFPMSYLAACNVFGFVTAWRQGDPALALMGSAAVVQHQAWGAGFWSGLVRRPHPSAGPDPIVVAPDAERAQIDLRGATIDVRTASGEQTVRSGNVAEADRLDDEGPLAA